MPARLALLVLLAAAHAPRAQAPRAQAPHTPPRLSAATFRAFADSVLTYRSYAGRTRTARVHLRANAAADRAERPFTVVVEDRAGNASPITEEAGFLAETVGRALSVDPAALVFVFRFTAASFTDGAPDRGKALHLRAVFRRGSSGALSAPSWRALSPDETEAYTDRAFR